MVWARGAAWLAHWTVNPEAAGSSPVEPAIHSAVNPQKSKGLAAFFVSDRRSSSASIGVNQAALGTRRAQENALAADLGATEDCFDSTGLKILVSAVQSRPCPPFFFRS